MLTYIQYKQRKGSLMKTFFLFIPTIVLNITHLGSVSSRKLSRVYMIFSKFIFYSYKYDYKEFISFFNYRTSLIVSTIIIFPSLLMWNDHYIFRYRSVPYRVFSAFYSLSIIYNPFLYYYIILLFYPQLLLWEYIASVHDFLPSLMFTHRRFYINIKCKCNQCTLKVPLPNNHVYLSTWYYQYLFIFSKFAQYCICLRLIIIFTLKLDKN